MAMALQSASISSHHLAKIPNSTRICFKNSQSMACSYSTVKPFTSSKIAFTSGRSAPTTLRKFSVRVNAESEGAAVAEIIPEAVSEEVAPEEEVEQVVEEVPTRRKKKLVDSPSRKQLLVLRFIWQEKNIGIALDQLVPGQGTVPISNYMFWPRKDAWEQLKALLDEKPWISRKRAIILLNQATDIINLWQSTSFKQ